MNAAFLLQSTDSQNVIDIFRMLEILQNFKILILRKCSYDYFHS